MDPAIIVDLGRTALYTVIIIAGPLLLVGLVVGLAVGVFQAVTQIHEMTLTFIPKILAIVGLLVAMLPWMVMKYIAFAVNLYNSIPALVN